MIRIPATKTNLFKAKRTLALCREGHQLLDEKRKILLMEISSTTQLVQKLEKDALDILVSAYKAVGRAIFSIGKINFESFATGVNIETELTITEKKLMGIRVPSIYLQMKENLPFFSPLGGHVSLDEAIVLMKQLIQSITELAEKKTTLLRLEREFQKTTKKVNALEKIHIPYYREVVRFIADRLDEESREAFATLKEIKKKLASRGV
ncbi:MAG: V-type ATP synthase subunit D [Candidatus Ratteibacteria bacterium]